MAFWMDDETMRYPSKDLIVSHYASSKNPPIDVIHYNLVFHL